MASLASAIFALIILLLPATANAGDLFSGFQLDGQAEYFSYLGLKEDLPWESFGLKGYVQLFAAGQSYEYESGNQNINADVPFLIPSLGVTKSLPGEWKKEDGFQNNSGRDLDIGMFVQGETMYWQETHSFQAMISYASLDDFFFGKARGKLRTYSPEKGCCPIFAGMDVAGMGNNDFSAVQTGPLI